MTAAPVTLLFTDLVESTGLLQRVGDERAQRILHAHRQLLREALASHGGREVKWLGDGLLTTFSSVADGVRCAVTMAQRARRPVAGERLGLRLGLHVGEVLPDEAEYMGTPVVLARRLCDRAAAGQPDPNTSALILERVTVSTGPLRRSVVAGPWSSSPGDSSRAGCRRSRDGPAVGADSQWHLPGAEAAWAPATPGPPRSTGGSHADPPALR